MDRAIDESDFFYLARKSTDLGTILEGTSLVSTLPINLLRSFVKALMSE